MKLRKGIYHFVPRGNCFRIYLCTEATPTSTTSVPVLDEPAFCDRQAARRRVYELNGWKLP